MRRRVLLPAGLGIVLFTLAISAAMIDRTSTPRPHPFSGLPGVHVQVSIKGLKGLQKDDYDLTPEAIKGEMISILRRKGVRVFSRDELALVTGRPTLRALVRGAVDPKSELAAIHVHIQVVEDTALTRNYQMKLRSETWAQTNTLLAGLHELEIIPQLIRKGTTDFCTKYSAVNPKARLYEGNHETDTDKDSQQSQSDNRGTP